MDGREARRRTDAPWPLCPAVWSTAFVGLEGGLDALLLVEPTGARVDARPWRIGICGGMLFSTPVKASRAGARRAVLAFRSDVGDLIEDELTNCETGQSLP